MNKLLLKIGSELRSSQLLYLFVGICLIGGFLLRSWKIDILLAFYFDQGRDALVVERILSGDLVLIGPVTGLKGIFLGPFYYYFLSPGYFLGGGNPVTASHWQTFFVMAGLLITFLAVRVYFSKTVALVILALMAFSYVKVMDDRWLANPTPTTLFNPLAILFFTLSFKKPAIFLPLATFSLGLLLQLEASISFFLIIITTLFILIYRKRFGLRAILSALAAFLVTLIPQLAFEIKNSFLLTKNLLGFITGNTYSDAEAVLQMPTQRVFSERFELYSNVFLDKLFIDSDKFAIGVFLVFLVTAGYFSIKYWSKPLVKITSFWFFGALFCFLFYMGNYGLVYAYYLTPIVPLFFILLGLILEQLLKSQTLKVVTVGAVIFLVIYQSKALLNELSRGIGGNTINLGVSSQAVKFVLSDSENKPFNVDIYVPPGIPYTYTYLFGYYGKSIGIQPTNELADILYTIHEDDLEIPKRQQDWLARQDGIGKVIETTKFGGVNIEKRARILYEQH